MRILVSITAHESVDCIIDMVKNINFFINNAVFIIHINSSSDMVFVELKKILLSNPLLLSKVFLTEDRVNSSKNTYCLEQAHIKNFELAKALNIQYDYLMLQASNCLFIEHGVEEYMKLKDIGLAAYKPSGYWKKSIIEHKALNQFLHIHLGKNIDLSELPLKGCHEGSFFKNGVDCKIFNIVSSISDFCKNLNDPPTYPTEEVWFQAARLIIDNYSLNPLNMVDTVTYLPWDRNLIWDKASIEKAMDNHELPRNKYAIKRVERHINDDVRTFIRLNSGY